MTQDLYFLLLNDSTQYMDTLGKVLETKDPKIDREIRKQIYDCMSIVTQILTDFIALADFLTNDE